MDLFDVEAVEAAESSTDQFIERRACQNDEDNRIEEQWNLHAVHQGLANRQRERAEALAEAPAEALLEPGETAEAVQSQRGNTTL